MPKFYIIIARKIFSRILGGTFPPALPSSTPMVMKRKVLLKLSANTRSVTALTRCPI